MSKNEFAHPPDQLIPKRKKLAMKMASLVNVVTKMVGQESLPHQKNIESATAGRAREASSCTLPS
jgi:hypothetical protein